MSIFNSILKKDLITDGRRKKEYELLIRLCAFLHSIFLLIFIYLEVYPMVIFNIGSVALYICLQKLIKKGNYLLATYIGYTEIIVHSVLATIMVGWNYGFPILIICLIPLAFYTSISNIKLTYLSSCSATAIFILLRIYSYFNSSVYNILTPVMEKIIYIFNSIVGLGIIMVFSFLFLKRVSDTQKLLIEKNRRLNIIANLDFLTNLLNRRSMYIKLEEAFNRQIDFKESFAVILCDIDDFKRINDLYGHDCGDYVLKCIAKRILKGVRIYDSVCRWGGEEILILLSDINDEALKVITSRIHNSIKEKSITYKENEINITMTCGVCISNSNISIDEMIIEADNKLYIGKSRGKNCIVY